MSLVLFNDLTRKKEVFTPQENSKVKMYACGISASADTHIGHAMQALHTDVIRKYLEYCGYDVTYVRNYTDINEGIIEKARASNTDVLVFASSYIRRISKDMMDLGIDKATVEPRASETIEEIIGLIEKLLAQGVAYITKDNDIFFDITTYEEYGKLSRRSLDKPPVIYGTFDLGDKRNPHDFVLWKSFELEGASWNSPWGKGCPGWHIECSAMCHKFLGESIDIHGGGKDLMFAHHDAEIALSESLFGKNFANYWVHCGHITIGDGIMSNHLGNTIETRDLLEKYHPEVIKYAILQSHYKDDLHLVDEIFEKAEEKLYSIYKTLFFISSYKQDQPSLFSKRIRLEFEEAMNDDFDSPRAILNLQTYLCEINEMLERKEYEPLYGVYETIKELYRIMSVFQEIPARFTGALEAKFFEK